MKAVALTSLKKLEVIETPKPQIVNDTNLDFMITHNFTTEQATEGFELVADYRDGVIKAFMDF